MERNIDFVVKCVNILLFFNKNQKIQVKKNYAGTVAWEGSGEPLGTVGA